MTKEDLLKLKKDIMQLSFEERRERDLYLRNLSIGNICGPMTGYASIDKPWLKFYKEENIGVIRDNSSAYEYMKKHNLDNLSYNAINYLGNRITYEELLNKIDEVTKSLIGLGVKEGDVATLIMANIPENVYLFYALNRLGAIANIIDPRLNEKEVIDIVNENNSRVLISIDTFIDEKFIENIKTNSLINNIILVNPVNSAKMNSILKSIILSQLL